MPPYSSVQKQQIAQFINFTQAKDTVAAKFLRAARWDVEQAIDA
jgi:DCN1-like protein 1/2